MLLELLQRAGADRQDASCWCGSPGPAGSSGSPTRSRRRAWNA